MSSNCTSSPSAVEPSPHLLLLFPSLSELCCAYAPASVFQRSLRESHHLWLLLYCLCCVSSISFPDAGATYLVSLFPETFELRIYICFCSAGTDIGHQILPPAKLTQEHTTINHHLTNLTSPLLLEETYANECQHLNCAGGHMLFSLPTSAPAQ